MLLRYAVRSELARQRARYLRQLADAERKIEETGGFTGPVTDGQAKASREIDVAVAALDALQPQPCNSGGEVR